MSSRSGHDNASSLVRLNKLMRDRDICSRREADVHIRAGHVLVDGAVASLGDLVRSSADVVLAKAGLEVKPLTIAVHKPRSFISQATNPRPGQRFAWQLLTWANQSRLCSHGRGKSELLEPLGLKKLGCCGRLDQDSSGLLIFSQDGRIARRLVGEANGEGAVVCKYYEVDVLFKNQGGNGGMQHAADHLEAVAERLRHGLVLDGETLRPAEVQWATAVPEPAYWDHTDRIQALGCRHRHDNFSRNRSEFRTLHMTLRQGKYRQIRRMCELVGLEVKRLVRVGVGGLHLGEHNSPGGLGLSRPGEWRVLDDAHLDLLTSRSNPLP